MGKISNITSDGRADVSNMVKITLDSVGVACEDIPVGSILRWKDRMKGYTPVDYRVQKNWNGKHISGWIVAANNGYPSSWGASTVNSCHDYDLYVPKAYVKNGKLKTPAKVDFTGWKKKPGKQPQPDMPLSYKVAKEIFAHAAEPAKGKVLRGDVRIFKNADNSYTVAHVSRNSNYYNQGGIRTNLFRLFANGKVKILVDPQSWHNSREAIHNAIADFTAVGGKNHARILRSLFVPRSGVKKPTYKKVPQVDRPRFVAKGEHGRDRYEENIAKYGDLEKWAEAYDKAEKMESANNRAKSEYEAKANVPIFPNLIIDPDGTANENSLKEKERAEKRKQALRKAILKAQEAERQKALESDRKRREAEEKPQRDWLKEANPNFDGSKLDITVINYLKNHNLIPDDNGNVIMVKAVDKDTHKTTNGGHYPAGSWVEAKDYKPSNYCGQGLHFTPTFHASRQYQGHNSIGMLCLINVTKDFDVIDAGKIKCRECYVIGEGDENTGLNDKNVQDEIAKARKKAEGRYNLSKTNAEKAEKKARNAYEKAEKEYYAARDKFDKSVEATRKIQHKIDNAGQRAVVKTVRDTILKDIPDNAPRIVIHGARR